MNKNSPPSEAEKALQDIIDRISNEVDNYLSTIDTVICFGHEMTWDNRNKSNYSDSYFSPGRKMNILTQEGEEREITPDIVILRSKDYGMIAEIKIGLARTNKRWDKIIKQVLSYDTGTDGWTDDYSILKHDVALLIPYKFSVLFQDYLTAINNDNMPTFKRNFAVISFQREDNRKSCITLQKIWGSLSDKQKDELLRTIIPVDMEKVRPLHSLIFCDAAPPLAYTMDKVWGHISNYKREAPAIDKKNTYITFTLEKLVEDLRKLNSVGPKDRRTPTLPRVDWIREAINELCNQKLIEKNKVDSSYYITYSKYDRLHNPIQKFKENLAKKELAQISKRSHINQLSLLAAN